MWQPIVAGDRRQPQRLADLDGAMSPAFHIHHRGLVIPFTESLAEGAQNYPDDHVANLDETTGHWLKISARDDGSFSVTNGRTSATRTYR